MKICKKCEYLKIIFRIFFRSKKDIILIDFFNKILKISFLHHKYILKVSLTSLLEIEGFCKVLEFR